MSNYNKDKDGSYVFFADQKINVPISILEKCQFGIGQNLDVVQLEHLISAEIEVSNMKAIKKARIFSSKDEKGRKQTVLVQGQKGKGAWICACTEGTSSVYSKRHAILYCKQIAEENDITHLFIENQFLVDDVAWVFRDGEYHIADNLGHAQKEKV